jgi:5'-phosphate synthase pdxT subunit
VTVERNSYGRQRESFEAETRTALGGGDALLRMIFIRAPRIRRVGPGVEVLARHGDDPVLAREGSVLVATFHPELTGDLTVHRFFSRMTEARATSV